MGQDIFERKIDQPYENCKGVVGIADDVQVFGNEETHDSMFQEAKEYMDKYIIKTKCCSFGNQYTPEGVKSDVKEVAIKHMQLSINKQYLKFTSRYGERLIYYMPNISYLNSDLGGLLKKDALFQWSEAHDVAFQKIKII